MREPFSRLVPSGFSFMPSGENSPKNTQEPVEAAGRHRRNIADDAAFPSPRSEGECMAELPADPDELMPLGQATVEMGARPIVWRGWLAGLVISLLCWGLIARLLGFI